MSMAVAGFSGTVLLQLPGVVGVVAGGHLSDFAARRESRRRMLVQWIAYSLAIPFPLLFAGTPGVVAAATAIVGFSLLRSLAVANENPLLCDLLPAHRRSFAIGLMNAANCTAGGVGIVVAGALKAQYGLAGPFAGVSGVLAVAAGVTAAGFLFVLPRRD